MESTTREERRWIAARCWLPLLDLIDFYFGPIVEATGEGRNQSKTYEADDIVHGSFRTESGGVCGTGLWCFNTCKNEDTTTIFGSKGILSYSVLDIGKPITLETEKGTEVLAVPDPPEHVAQPLIQPSPMNCWGGRAAVSAQERVVCVLTG